MELKEMFEKQKKLQKQFLDVDLPQDIPEQFYMHAMAANVEISEAVQEDNRWKKCLGGKLNIKLNNEAKLEELVDAMHFIINSVLFSGFDYEDFVKSYEIKNNKNFNKFKKE